MGKRCLDEGSSQGFPAYTEVAIRYQLAVRPRLAPVNAEKPGRICAISRQ